MLPAPLRGIVTPLITPLLKKGGIDSESLARLVEHTIAGGIHGLFLLGTTGEGPAMSRALRVAMVEQTCKLVRERVPVLVGITDTSYDEALIMARTAAEAGASAVVSAGPLYYQVSQKLLLQYFKRLAAESPLPLVLYNMPSCTQVRIPSGTVLRAAEERNIAGMKDSSGDMAYFHQLLRGLQKRPEFTLLVGPEELMAESVLMGAHGGVNGGSNLWPRLYTTLYEAARSGNLAVVARLQPVVVEACGRLFDAGSYGEHYLEGLKYAAHLLGLCSPAVSMPYGQLSDSGKREIEQVVAEIGEKARAVEAKITTHM